PVRLSPCFKNGSALPAGMCGHEIRPAQVEHGRILVVTVSTAKHIPALLLMALAVPYARGQVVYSVCQLLLNPTEHSGEVISVRGVQVQVPSAIGDPDCECGCGGFACARGPVE